jgi:Sec-independent protein translocase protein TatA
MTFLIDSIVTAIVAILIATIDVIPFMAGPEGVLIGIVASVVVLFLGKDKMQEAMLSSDIPKAVRRLIPKSAFSSRSASISADIKESFYETLKKEKNDEISERMINEISGQIETTLARMAEVDEIPLG